jgi:hypothetical protein
VTEGAFVSIRSAARALHVSWWWVWRRIQSGEIDARRLSETSQYMIPRTALEPFVQRLHNLHKKRA